MDDVEIVALSGVDAHACVESLADVLIACVHAGASVSFMSPLDRDKAVHFWREIANGVSRGERVLIVAKELSSARVVGTVQIIVKQPENQPHRADLAKMLVDPHVRRRGIGAQLLHFAEDAARSAGKTLLVLDTATGGDAERLYERAGWQRAGVIPDYALYPDGRFCDTTIFYKRLGASPGYAN